MSRREPGLSTSQATHKFVNADRPVVEGKLVIRFWFRDLQRMMRQSDSNYTLAQSHNVDSFDKPVNAADGSMPAIRLDTNRLLHPVTRLDSLMHMPHNSVSCGSQTNGALERVLIWL